MTRLPPWPVSTQRRRSPVGAHRSIAAPLSSNNTPHAFFGRVISSRAREVLGSPKRPTLVKVTRLRPVVSESNFSGSAMARRMMRVSSSPSERSPQPRRRLDAHATRREARRIAPLSHGALRRRRHTRAPRVHRAARAPRAGTPSCADAFTTCTKGRRESGNENPLSSVAATFSSRGSGCDLVPTPLKIDAPASSETSGPHVAQQPRLGAADAEHLRTRLVATSARQP